MIIIKAPNEFEQYITKKPMVFLAGSIEMGAAENWQQRVERMLLGVDVVVLNPRRDNWDSSWEQSIDNPQFKEQVTWELRAMDSADMIAMNFCADTKSPITLLELGLHTRAGNLIVHCPEGFWRKGNVDIVCWWYGVERAESINDLVEKTIKRLGE